MPRSLLGIFTVALAAAFVVPTPAPADEAELRGSPSSMIRQHSVAEANDFTFLRTASQIESFVARGYLVRVESSRDYEVLPSVSHPYARPELQMFIARLGAQHRAACGERLVITSLTRPTSGQPSNSHPLSVHPTGMAVDLRVLSNGTCRSWLESTLLEMEASGLLDVTRERRPPHYHVAVFPDVYREYAAPLIARDSARAVAALAEAEREREAAALAKLAAASSAMLHPAQEGGRTEMGMSNLALLIAGLPLALGAVLLRASRRRRAADRAR